MAEARKPAARPAEPDAPARAGSRPDSPIAAAARARAAELEAAAQARRSAGSSTTRTKGAPKGARTAAPKAAPKAAPESAPEAAATTKAARLTKPARLTRTAAPAPVDAPPAEVAPATPVAEVAAPVEPLPADLLEGDSPEPRRGPLGPLERLGARTLALSTVVASLVALVLAVLLVLGAGGGGGDSKARESDRADALAAARSFATALTTFDYRALDTGFAAVTDASTGTFKEQYSKTTTALRTALTKAKATSKSTVLGSGVDTLADGKAKVVLFVDQTITNSTNKTPRVDRNRVILSLTEVDGVWLVNDVTLT